MQTKITIKGMSCQNCVRHVTEFLTEVSTIKLLEVNLEQEYALIEGEFDQAQITELIQEEGYEATDFQTI